MSAEPPIPLCLLIADRVYQDRESGNSIIAGAFNTIVVSKLPFQYPQLSIFFQITGVTEAGDLRLVIELAEDGSEIFNIGGPMRLRDPMDVGAKHVRINGLPLQRAGKYWVQLRQQSQILIQAPLYVKVKRPRTENQEQESQ